MGETYIDVSPNFLLIYSFDKSIISLALGKTRRNWAFSSAGRAPPWHGGGHRFDPDKVHQIDYKSAFLRLRVLVITELGSYAESFFILKLSRSISIFCCLLSLSIGHSNCLS